MSDAQTFFCDRCGRDDAAVTWPVALCRFCMGSVVRDNDSPQPWGKKEQDDTA